MGGHGTSSEHRGGRLSVIREQDSQGSGCSMLAVGQAGMAGFTEEIGRALGPQLCLMLGPDLTHAAHRGRRIL